jgi:prevent-host-death family protein
MRSLTVTEAKAKLPQIIREVEDYQHVYLTKNGKIACVIVKIDEWENIQETLEILSDPSLMDQIKKSERSKKLYTLREVFGDLKT